MLEDFSYAVLIMMFSFSWHSGTVAIITDPKGVVGREYLPGIINAAAGRLSWPKKTTRWVAFI